MKKDAAPPVEPSHRFLDACRIQLVDRTPVWFMRQAGRYLPEYRAARGDRDILEVCRSPDLAAELTLQPLKRLDVDAAILFSDIMVPVAAAGVDVRIPSGVGPVVPDPIRCADDVRRLRKLEPEADVPYVLEAIRILRRELHVPLIGFAGGPFTLASYLIEGQPSRDHAKTKALMHSDEKTWRLLMDTLADIVVIFLRAQVAAGVQAIQIFDSWAGTLDVEDYSEFVLHVTTRIFSGLEDLGVPRIHFGVDTGQLLHLMRLAGADVVGVDWRTPIDAAWARIGFDAGVQGNLDPALCLAPWEAVERKTMSILGRIGGRPGHIFNLGHGVLPSTPVETLQRLVDLVHTKTEGHPDYREHLD